MIRGFFSASSTLVLLIFLMKSCGTPQHRNELQDLEWLTGNWESSSDIAFKESWEIAGTGRMKGVGYSMEGSDTLMFEHLEIFSSDSGTFYRVLVQDQNENMSVFFKLLLSKPDSLVFVNPAHDFPKYIVYRKLDNDRLRVHVRDGFGDESRGFDLEMTKLTD